MKPIYYALIFIALLATGASNRTNVPSLIPDDTLHATNGAYRDGLYLGNLDRSNSRHHHLSSGRWNNSADRHSFAAGYEDGYSKPTKN